MKKILLTLMFICMFSPLLQAEGFDARIDQSFKEQTADFFGIYHRVRRELMSYYNRQYFQDADRSSGWYRVDDFLKWLYQNESALKKSYVLLGYEKVSLNQLYMSLEDDMHRKIFWGYLGARYAFEQMGLDGNLLENYPFSICSESTCYAIASENSITLGKTERADYVGFFNIGMHEAVHILPLKSKRQGTSDVLPESATGKAQNLWGLPVHIKNGFYAGVRDFRVSYQRGVSAEKLISEYAETVPSALYKKDIFKAKQHRESLTFCGLLNKFKTPVPFYQLSKKYWLDPVKNERLLKDFFGAEKWTQAQRKAEEKGYVVLGRYSYQDIQPLYEQYFKQYWKELGDNMELYNEKVNEDLAVLNPQARYVAFLYTNGREMEFAFFPTKSFDAYFDTTLIEHLGNSVEAIPFYQRLIGRFYKTGFSCEKTVEEAVKLLDEMAGPQTRSVVPEGYI